MKSLACLTLGAGHDAVSDVFCVEWAIVAATYPPMPWPSVQKQHVQNSMVFYSQWLVLINVNTKFNHNVKRVFPDVCQYVSVTDRCTARQSPDVSPESNENVFPHLRKNLIKCTTASTVSPLLGISSPWSKDPQWFVFKTTGMLKIVHLLIGSSPPGDTHSFLSQGCQSEEDSHALLWDFL